MKVRTLWSRAHWLLGISAGTVLVLTGASGALLSFEPELLRALNPGVLRVATQAGERATPQQLLAWTAGNLPGRRIVSVTLSARAGDPAIIGLQAADGGRRSEPAYIDPWSGALLGQPRGEAAFHLIEDIHRTLAAGPAGKAITGACTVILLVLALSGLYLRWPRRHRWDLRRWLVVDVHRRGRGFISNLHGVAGTWALPCYLLAALTGLSWSYDSYRHALHVLTGTPLPPPRTAPATAGARAPQRTIDAAPAYPTLEVAWQAFLQERGQDYSRVTLRLPERSGEPLQLSYLDAVPAHERAFNRMAIDPASGRISGHERYADKPAGARLIGSLYPLHTGSFFGLPGRVAMMLASLLLPLFGITGWMLYLQRRRQRAAQRQRRRAAAA